MRFPVLARSFVLAAGLGLLLPTPSHSQVLNRLKNAAMDEAERQAERLVRDAIRCTLQDSACPLQAEASGEEVIFVDERGEVITDEDGMPITDREEARRRAGVHDDGDSEPGRPGEGVWANYDFVPGHRVLFAEDFSDDAVGDFPRRFDLVGGNWDVVEWQGRRLLRNTGPRNAAIALPLPETLPERFTIEFDAFLPHGNQSLVVGTTRPDGRNHAAYPGNYFRVDGRRSGLDSRTGAVKVLNQARALNEALVTVRIMADGEHVKMYVGEQRVANAPGAELERGREIYLENTYFADQENPMLFGNFRIAAGGADLYERLTAEDRVATQGIYFDSGSDRLRPESTPTLNEIAALLTDHPDLDLTIEGHTDATGDEAANLALSERRARAVVRHLVDAHGIDPARLEAVGRGASSPMADNATPEGRQQNRRVELVKH